MPERQGQEELGSVGMTQSKARSCHEVGRHPSQNNSICTIFRPQHDSMGNGADRGKVEREQASAAVGRRQRMETD